jgi:hypothetical protein
MLYYGHLPRYPGDPFGRVPWPIKPEPLEPLPPAPY